MDILKQEIKPGFLSMKFSTSGIPEIELIDNGLSKAISDSTGAIRTMCSHIMNAGGKRIRPLLVLYSGMMFAELNDRLVTAAVAAELIHMASLVHDDIIDNSPLRRSKPSVNKVWGNHFAVLCGDYLFAKAFGILSGSRMNRSMDYMVAAIQSMCSGEIMQASERFNNAADISRYYELIAKKTGIFLECCCKSGAAISGADEGQIAAVGEYGLNLGYAFQIVDDILDFCGDVTAMGKPRGEDLRQGNITIPVILLLKHREYGEWCKSIILKKEYTANDIEDITSALKESGIVEECFCTARSHIDKAKEKLQLMPQSRYTTLLHNMADMLQARMN